MYKQKKIIHIDMDCFYAAVEMRDNPRLKYIPLGIGGPSNSRGVLCTANYEARKFGVRSGMACSVAKRKCPQLELMKPNFYKYQEANKIIMEIFRQYTDTIEPLSLDEAYLDVSDSDLFYNSATWMAMDIIRKIKRETLLDASAGIAPNKFLAKVASDWRKPQGLFTISPEDINDFVPQLDIRKIPGVGKVTEEKLKNLGIHNCEDIQKRGPQFMKLAFGKFGSVLYERSFGKDLRNVGNTRERKSLSCERTFFEDYNDKEFLKKELYSLIDEALKRLMAFKEKNPQSLPPDKIFVKTKTKFFDVHTAECKITEEIVREFWEQETIPMDLWKKASDLLLEAYARKNEPLRLIGFGFRLKGSHLEEDLEDCSGQLRLL